MDNRASLPRSPTGEQSQPDEKLIIDMPGPQGAEPVTISTPQSGLSPAVHRNVRIGDTITWIAESGRFAADLEIAIVDGKPAFVCFILVFQLKLSKLDNP